MTLRTAAIAGITIAIIVAACASDGNEKPTLAVPYSTHTADPLARCFDESALPERFTLTSELVLDNAAAIERRGADQQGELAQLYGEWGRVSGGERSYSAADRPRETPLAPTALFDGRFDSVSCAVELYQEADGASKAFAGTGFGGPLLGEPDRGTFRFVANPEIGAESRQYLQVHAVVSGSVILFRTGNVLGRVAVGGPSSSFADAEKAELTAETVHLALVLLEQLERDSGEPTSESFGVSSVPASLELDAFYEKYVDAGGIPVVGSRNVEDEALLAARVIIQGMTQNMPEIRAAMISADAYVGIMAEAEVTTDIPEHADLRQDPNTDWDQRARGLGGVLGNPITTGAEENVLAEHPIDTRARASSFTNLHTRSSTWEL